MKPLHPKRSLIYIAASLIVAGLGLILLIQALPATAAPKANTVLFMKAGSEEIAVGDEITVTVRISDVVALYGIEFTLNFTPTSLQVIDADPGKDGVQITPAEYPIPDLELTNEANNTAGTIEYAVSQWNPTPPFDGDCAVAHIRFKALEATTTRVRFAAFLLSDDDFNMIPAGAVDLALEIKESDFYVYLPAVMK